MLILELVEEIEDSLPMHAIEPSLRVRRRRLSWGPRRLEMITTDVQAGESASSSLDAGYHGLWF